MTVDDRFAKYRKKAEDRGSLIFTKENLIMVVLLLATVALCYFAAPKLRYLLETKTDVGRQVAKSRRKRRESRDRETGRHA